MATVPQCDRCKSLNVQVVPVLGVDLCTRCIDAFHVWAADAGIKLAPSGRAGCGERMKQACKAIQRDGYVTSESLAELSGMTRVQANGYLHARAKQGALLFVGGRRFVLPRDA
jgi:hypothetical protein